MLGALGGCKWKASVDFQINGGGSSQFLRGREKSVQTNVCEFLRRHRKSSDGNSAPSCSHRFALFLIYFLWCVFVKTVDDSFVCSRVNVYIYAFFVRLYFRQVVVFAACMVRWLTAWHKVDTTMIRWCKSVADGDSVYMQGTGLEEWENKSKHTRV